MRVEFNLERELDKLVMLAAMSTKSNDGARWYWQTRDAIIEEFNRLKDRLSQLERS